MKKYFFTTVFILLFAFSFICGQIDSQWRGPNRDGKYPEKNLINKWPESGPKVIWTINGLGKGYSSPAVTLDRIYLTGMKDGKGYLYSYDYDGRLLWEMSYGKEWKGSRPGARTTPTVAADKIYLQSAEGQTVCVGKDGKIIWSLDLIKEFQARNIKWGITESLFVDGDRLYCTPGGPDIIMAALDRHTGKTIWKATGNGDKSGYCSPLLITYNKKKLLITMTAKSIVGLSADTGKLLWSHPHITDWDVNPNTPLFQNGFIYSFSGYGTGGQMFKLSDDGKQISPVWTQKKLDSQMGSAILLDGHIYGSGHSNRGWFCLDWKTGNVLYNEKKLGSKGNIIYANGMLYCYSERGDVGLVKPNPSKFEIVSSFKMKEGSGEHWAHPVIKKGRLYIRHGDAMVAYSISQ